MYIYINTLSNYSQPTLIKLDNENIGGHLTPLHPLGGSGRNIAIPFGTEKLEWLGYPMVKKFGRYIYSF